MKLTTLLFRIFSIYSKILPHSAARTALHLFQKTGKIKVREREKLFYQQARVQYVVIDDRPVACYSMGDPTSPPVVLVHGWNSHPGSMFGIADHLKERHHVVALNLPGHYNAAVKKTNLFESAGQIEKILRALNLNGTPSFVTHSFGSAVVALMLKQSQIKVKNLVFITSPNKMMDIFQGLKSQFMMSQKAFDRLIDIITNEIGPARKTEVEQLTKQIDYDRFVLFHDPADQLIPYRDSVAIASKNSNAQLISMENSGHYRILWSKELLAHLDGILDDKKVNTPIPLIN